MRVIAPLVLEASITAIAHRERTGADMLRQKEFALEQARYEVARAHRQYDAVDPDNRLVAGDLERRWNGRLAEAARLEGELLTLRKNQPPPMTETGRSGVFAFGGEVAGVWNHPVA